jgi:hypothetical protein
VSDEPTEAQWLEGTWRGAREHDEWRRIHQRAAADVRHQIDDDLAWWHSIGEAWPEEGQR